MLPPEGGPLQIGVLATSQEAWPEVARNGRKPVRQNRVERRQASVLRNQHAAARSRSVCANCINLFSGRGGSTHACRRSASLFRGQRKEGIRLLPRYRGALFEKVNWKTRARMRSGNGAACSLAAVPGSSRRETGQSDGGRRLRGAVQSRGGVAHAAIATPSNCGATVRSHAAANCEPAAAMPNFASTARSIACRAPCSGRRARLFWPRRRAISARPSVPRGNACRMSSRHKSAP